jgi:cytochrome c-type biogenesis protein CcmF
VAAHDEGFATAVVRLVGANRHRYGGYVAHIGVLVAALGVAASASSKVEHEQTLKPGETTSAAGVTLRLESVWGQQQPQRFAVGAELTMLRDGRPIGTLVPRQNFYPSQEQPVPTPAVRSRPLADVYVNLMAFASDGSTATVRLPVEPLVLWIWLGGLVCCLGGGIALWPRRRAAHAATSVATAPLEHQPATLRRKRRAASRRAPSAEVAT